MHQASSATRYEPQTGTRFALLGVLGHGGQATVYRARRLVGDSAPVALKVMSTTSDDAARRARDEARIMRHVFELGANIVEVRALYELTGTRQVAIEMALVRGVTLDRLLRDRGPLDEELAVEVILRVAEVLTVCHDAGVINRDLKPENILVDEGGRVLPFDFGTCSWDGEKREAATELGHVMGTVPYMAPEIFQRALSGVDDDRWELTDKVDVFALGATLFEALAGHTLTSDDLAARLRRIKGGEEDARNERAVQALGLPPGLEMLLRRMVTADPAMRPSARAVADRLRELGYGDAGAVAVWAEQSPMRPAEEALDGSRVQVIDVGMPLPWVDGAELFGGPDRDERDPSLAPFERDDISLPTAEVPASRGKLRKPGISMVERAAYAATIGALAVGCVGSFLVGWWAAQPAPIDVPAQPVVLEARAAPPGPGEGWSAELEAAVIECHQDRADLREQLESCSYRRSSVRGEHRELEREIMRLQRRYDIVVSTLKAGADECEAQLLAARVDVEELADLAECATQCRRCQDIAP